MFDHTVIEAVEGSTHIEIFKAAGIVSDPLYSEESFQIASSLDLEKQAAAHKTEKSLIEWPVASKTEISVYCVCFPQAVGLLDYEEPIPLSVLREIERASKIECDNKTFWKFVVLGPVKGRISDPVLVGYFGVKDKPWESKPHIIARWGSSLLPFDELTKIARERMAESIKAAISKAKYDLERLSSAHPSTWDIAVPSWGETTLARYETCLGI